MSALVYPVIGDWTRYVADRMPSYLGGEPQYGMVQLLADPLNEIDASFASMTFGLDPAAAVGAQLDQLGSWVDERRGGLDDAEYRRIIMGREAAQTSDGSVAALWPLWVALTGAPEDSARIVVVPWSGAPIAYFEAIVQVEPSLSFRKRAGAVWRDAVAFPIDALGVLARSDGLVWNTVVGWNTGTWGSALPYEVP